MNDTIRAIFGTTTSGLFGFLAFVLPAFQLVAALIAIIAGLYAIDHWRAKRRLRKAMESHDAN